MLGMTGRHLLGMTDRLSARMMLKNHLLPCRAVDMGVDLGRGKALMSEHLLDHSQVCSILDQMSRK